MSNLSDAMQPPVDAPAADLAAPRDDINAAPWWSIVGCIAVAGGSYPVTLALVGLCCGVVFTVIDVLFDHGPLPSLDDVIGGVMGMGLTGGVGGLIGIVWAFFAALLTMPVFSLFLRSMRLRPTFIWRGAILGGLVGFLAVLPFLVAALTDPVFSSPWSTLVLLSLGPGLTTVLGQAGGAWGGRRAARLAAADADVSVPVVSRSPRFQFGTGQLLWLTAWVSVPLAIVSATPAPLFFLAIVGGWLVYQAGTLYLGAMLLPVLARRWAARRAGRST